MAFFTYIKFTTCFSWGYPKVGEESCNAFLDSEGNVFYDSEGNVFCVKEEL